MRRIAARPWILVLGALCGAAPWTACGPGAPVLPEPSRHLVVLTVDTLRADHVGVYGYERATTPWIDSLAQFGSVVEYAYAHSSWTVPSTGSLFTSLLPSEHGAMAPGEIKNVGADNLPLDLRGDVRTLPQILREAGFRTAVFSPNINLHGGFSRGFEVHDIAPAHAGVVVDKALEWLARDDDRPFFLYLQFMDVHEPVHPPEPFFSFFEAGTGERGPEHARWAFKAHEDWEAEDFVNFREHRLALYDGALRFVDNEIGRFVGELERAGLMDDTLLVITSDHGEEFWDHGELQRRIGGDPRGFWGVGHGHALFEELLRVPLVFWGRQVLAGERIACEIGQVDVAPTVLELLGLEPEADMRGRSLAPLLLGGADAVACPEAPIFAEALGYGIDARAVISERKKVIVRDDGLRLAYDLAADPGETRDLAGEGPAWVEDLGELLKRFAASRPAVRTAPMDFDEEARERLRSLGYAE